MKAILTLLAALLLRGCIIPPVGSSRHRHV